MKELKNIVTDLWELFFPLMIRLFLTFCIIVFIIDQTGQAKLFAQINSTLSYFIEHSKLFLTSIDLEKFTGVYLLVVSILCCYTFNYILIFLNSIFRISIYWRGYVDVAIDSVSELLKFFPKQIQIIDLENEIRKVIFIASSENKYNIADDEKRFNERIQKLRVYIDVITFELLLTPLLSIFYWKHIIGLKFILVFLVLLLCIFFGLSKAAHEVKKHYELIVYKVRLILNQPQISDEEARESIAKLQVSVDQKWWGISLILGNIRETLKSIGGLEINWKKPK